MTLTEVDGNITSIYDGKLLNTQTFTYDALNRLTSAVSTGGASAYALENTTYNSSTGNLASKAGVTYGYQDTAHVHGVTHLNNVQKYWYDANGNQVTRKVGGVTHTLTYDGENRLVKVMNGSTTIASFVYDGDGQRVKSTLNGVTTTFVGNYYEKTGTNITKYYYAGAARVAMRNTSVKYLFGDQLGSTSVTTNSSGVIGSQERYKPFGEMYYTSGTLPTRYTFTGQYSYTINTNEIGLLYYGARFYDPVLGRFAQADTIIPGAGNPLAWDRFAYVNNNPLRYTDPSGHMCSDPEAPNQRCDGGGADKNYNGFTGNSNQGTTSLPSSPQSALPQPPGSIPLVPTYPDSLLPSPHTERQCTKDRPCTSAWETPEWWNMDPKDPDYYVFTLNWGEALGVTASFTIDRYGNIYIGGGGNIGKSISPISVSLNGGWIGSPTDNIIPDQANIDQFLTGVSINAQAGAVGDIAMTYSPGVDRSLISPTSSEYGAVLPFSIGISATYSFKLIDGYQLFGRK